MQHSYYSNTVISTATTTTIVSTADLVVLSKIILPKTTVGAVTFEDITGTPVVYFTLPAATVAGTLDFTDIVLPNGLKVVTASADNVIVVWKQG